MKHLRSDKPWSTRAEDMLTALDTSIDGLTEKEAWRRIERFGPNRLREIERRSIWSILWDQIKSLIMLLLVVAMIVSFATDQPVEGLAIAAVILINTAIGFITEWRAVRSMEALQKMGRCRPLFAVRARRAARQPPISFPGTLWFSRRGRSFLPTRDS